MGRAGGAPADFDAARLTHMASFDHLVAAVEDCMDAGPLPRGDQTLVALGLWAVVHGITSLMISKPEYQWPDRDAFADDLCELQVPGLGGLAEATRGTDQNWPLVRGAQLDHVAIV